MSLVHPESVLDSQTGSESVMHSNSTTINPDHQAVDVLFTPLTLPISGLTLRNRLVKPALYEHLSSFGGGAPNSTHVALYSRWANAGWGMIVSGNVLVNARHLTLGRDLLPLHARGPPGAGGASDERERFARLAGCVKAGGAVAIAQLSHAGRQSPSVLGGRWFGRPDAPSAVPLKGQGLLGRVLFRTPREMEVADVENVIADFVRAGKAMFEAGWDGVQLHVAHGYLLAQFLSRKTNHRTDQYSVSSALDIVRRIVSDIRSCTSPAFVVGVKLNSADYSSAGDSDEERALEHVRTMAQWGTVDFIEVSGGDYEDPGFMSSTGSTRQALFARFASRAVRAVSPYSRAPVIMLTGGLRTREVMRTAIDRGDAHLLGIGRGSILCPELPLKLERAAHPESTPEEKAFLVRPMREPDVELPKWLERIPVKLPKLVGAGVSMAWYTVMLRRLAQGKEVDYGVGALRAIAEMWVPASWMKRGAVVGVGVVAAAVIALLITPESA